MSNNVLIVIIIFVFVWSLFNGSKKVKEGYCSDKAEAVDRWKETSCPDGVNKKVYMCCRSPRHIGGIAGDSTFVCKKNNVLNKEGKPLKDSCAVQGSAIYFSKRKTIGCTPPLTYNHKHKAFCVYSDNHGNHNAPLRGSPNCPTKLSNY